MPNVPNKVNVIKALFKTFFTALGAGIIANLIARFSVFPIMAILHNRWVDILSYETVDLVYFWIGQIVGSLVFVVYMYTDLNNRNWPIIFRIIAIIISFSLLVTTGIVLGKFLGNP